MKSSASLLVQFDIISRFQSLFTWLADKDRLPKIQQAIVVLLLLWGVNSLANSVWALVPSPPIEIPSSSVINAPPTFLNGSASFEEVDVSPILGQRVFGAVENPIEENPVPVSAAVNPREGIENGARETSLALKLAGIVASTSDGLGSAMIEARKNQELYSVGDELPANGRVLLAKILPKQVVIDNNGTYELITLFDANGIAGIVQSAAPKPKLPESSASLTPVESSSSREERQRLAANYRNQLYRDPQSLAGLVSISAVQTEGGLKGYRLAPGKDAEQFTALGFRAGDIVTAVNGYALSDPTNTVRLYQLMRDATGATFEVEREGSPVSISVSLGSLQ